MAGVDSSPVYVFHPLVPYRIKMVLPRVKFVLLLRDPTERRVDRSCMHGVLEMAWKRARVCMYVMSVVPE